MLRYFRCRFRYYADFIRHTKMRSLFDFAIDISLLKVTLRYAYFRLRRDAIPGCHAGYSRHKEAAMPQRAAIIMPAAVFAP